VTVDLHNYAQHSLLLGGKVAVVKLEDDEVAIDQREHILER
jgi:hypothetical protein